MRAALLTAPNTLTITDAPLPTPGPGEARVRVAAAALNHRDAWILQGQYAGTTFPVQPGSDASGTVDAVGSPTDASWLGRAVIINPSITWGTSPAAQGPGFSILGSPRPGTLAEAVCVPVTQLAPKPPHLDELTAAALPLAGLTAYRALFTRARLQPGERVLISGVGGGVALLALQFAVAAGARVWVTSSSTDKIERARTLGAEGGFLYTHEAWAAEATRDGLAFDVIVDSAGGPGFDALVEAAAPGARIVFFGATRGNVPQLAVRKVFWRQLSLLGTTLGSPQDWNDLLAFVERHNVRPVVDSVFPLERAVAAFERMQAGAQFGKIVVTVNATPVA